MAFIISMFFTTLIGFFICYGFRRYLGLTEKIFVSIFVGWEYFTGMVILFSNNFPKIYLSEMVLFSLIVSSLAIAIGIFVIVKLKSLFRVGIKREHVTPRDSKIKWYLIIPATLIIIMLLSVAADSFLNTRICSNDPIFEWNQRGELIFLGESLSAQMAHPFGYYPLHIPILHAWTYFFHFDNPRIFYLIGFIGMIAILLRHIRRYSGSMYCALIFSAMIGSAQMLYTRDSYAEGITNIYFIVGILYALKYIETRNIVFLLLIAAFMTMFASARAEGVLYTMMLLLFLVAISLINRTLKISHAGAYMLPFLAFYCLPKLKLQWLALISILSFLTLAIVPIIKKLFKVKRVLFYFLALFAALSCCIVFGKYKGHGRIYEIVMRFFSDILQNWGGIYENKQLLHYYHANNLTCMVMSFVVFLESLFCGTQSQHAYNLLKAFLSVFQQMSLTMWALFILALLTVIKKRDMMMKLIIFVIFPLVTYVAILCFLQVKFYWITQNGWDYVISYPRHKCLTMIGLILFISTSEFVRRMFAEIEQRKVLAYALNLPILYIVVSHVWRILLTYI